MRYACDKSTTQFVHVNQLACDCHVQHEDCHVQHEECRGLLKHILKPYDNCSHRQFEYHGNCVRSFHDASSACYKNPMQQL